MELKSWFCQAPNTDLTDELPKSDSRDGLPTIQKHLLDVLNLSGNEG